MKCDVCGAKVKELRRGRCWGCYSRWVESRPVGLGACCTLCGDRRRENLKSVELLGAWMPACHNCAARAMSLDPLPRSIAAIREQLARDRRADERRVGKRDTRVFRRERRADERRRSERNGESRNPIALIDDEMILEIEELGHELVRDAHDGGELTRIHDLGTSS